MNKLCPPIFNYRRVLKGRIEIKIKLYWQEFQDKADILVNVKDREMQACFEILHGFQELEMFENWRNDIGFYETYLKIEQKCENYVNKIKRLHRLNPNYWDWDWAE